MLKNLSEYGKWIKITGYKNVRLTDTNAFLKEIRGTIDSEVEVQLFNADLLATWQHLYFAILNAAMAMETKRNISKSLAVEVLLYASAQRQINKAIELIGVNDGGPTNVAMLVLGDNEASVKKASSIISKFMNSEENLNVLGTSDLKNKQLKKAFKITDEELTAPNRADKSADPMVEAILERIALLSTQL